jgi:hypothetical protein
LKLSIVTAAPPALGADCCDALGFAAPCALCELSELPQPAIDAATAAAATSKAVRCVGRTAMLHSVTTDEDELARAYGRRHGGQDGHAHG